MGVIIKNADVDSLESRKVTYTSPIDTHAVSAIDADINIQDYDNEVDYELEANLLENEILQSKELSESANVVDEVVPEFQMVADGIKHHGEIYVHPSTIDELVKIQLTEKINEYEKSFDEKKEQGYKDGHKEGVSAAEDEFIYKFEAIDNLFETISNSFKAKVGDVEQLITDAIFDGITRVLGETISSNDDRMNMIQNVVKNVASTQPYTLRLSEHDYKLVMENSTSNANCEKIISDDRVELGGCIIETNKGIFDGRLEVQLARLKDAIDSKVD